MTEKKKKLIKCGKCKKRINVKYSNCPNCGTVQKPRGFEFLYYYALMILFASIIFSTFLFFLAPGPWIIIGFVFGLFFTVIFIPFFFWELVNFFKIPLWKIKNKYLQHLAHFFLMVFIFFFISFIVFFIKEVFINISTDILQIIMMFPAYLLPFYAMFAGFLEILSLPLLVKKIKIFNKKIKIVNYSLYFIIIIFIIISLVSWKFIDIFTGNDLISNYKYIHFIFALLISPVLMYLGFKNLSQELEFNSRKEREYYLRPVLLMAIFGLPFIILLEIWFLTPSMWDRKDLISMNFLLMDLGHANSNYFVEMQQTIITLMEVIGIILAFYFLIKFKDQMDSSLRNNYLKKSLKTIFLVGIIISIPLTLIIYDFSGKYNSIDEISVYMDRNKIIIDFEIIDTKDSEFNLVVFVPDYLNLTDVYYPENITMTAIDTNSSGKHQIFSELENSIEFDYMSKDKILSMDFKRYDLIGKFDRYYEKYATWETHEICRIIINFTKNGTGQINEDDLVVIAVFYKNNKIVDFWYYLKD